MAKQWMILVGALALVFAAGAAEPEVLYSNDFSKEEIDSEPLDFLVLSGGFTVKEREGNKVLELPGAPLDSHGLIFGPVESDGVEVSARAITDRKGRLYSAFGVGLNGVGGYRLIVAPAKRAIELYRNEDVVAKIDHKWAPNVWTYFELRVTKTGDSEWQVQGRVWQEGDAKPADWMISYTEKESIIPGKASIWGRPYAGKEIDYDDLKLTRIAPAK